MSRLVIIRSITQSMLAVLVLLGAARLVFRPDPYNNLRRGDAQFAAGHYYEALQLYTLVEQHIPQEPRALVRRGMIETVRGEAIQASRTFAQAINQGASRQDYELARLYQGYALALNGQYDEAFGLWRLIDEDMQLYPFRRALEAEMLLQSGQYAEAESTFRVAIHAGLPARWARFAHSRVAALRATSDLIGAQAELAVLNTLPQHESSNDLVEALLPAPAPAPEQLGAALAAPPLKQAQQLGYLYLDGGLYELAEAQFMAVPPDSPFSLGAKAYAAYARLQTNDQGSGLERLEALVAEHPKDARARALLALAFLERTNPTQAKAQLEIIRRLAPSPDTHLAWGQWYVTQHDYLAAADQYRLALDAAPLEQRGTYALALARFHLDTTVRACESGASAAKEAARLLNNGAAWTALAEAHLACGDARLARDAAATALQYAANSAEAHFYLGQGLALLGERAEARQAFIAAADLAPASDWRVKAERQLAAFGL